MIYDRRAAICGSVFAFLVSMEPTLSIPERFIPSRDVAGCDPPEGTHCPFGWRRTLTWAAPVASFYSRAGRNQSLGSQTSSKDLSSRPSTSQTSPRATRAQMGTCLPSVERAQKLRKSDLQQVSLMSRNPQGELPPLLPNPGNLFRY